jgi:hypothetical protein
LVSLTGHKKVLPEYLEGARAKEKSQKPL